MSWIDQCKLAFRTKAEAMLWNKTKDIDSIINILSDNSGIPLSILHIWWKDRDIKQFPDQQLPDMCLLCRKNTVWKASAKAGKKPLSSKALNHGLCQSCGRYMGTVRTADYRLKSGIPTSCPRCHHIYFINPERLKVEVRDGTLHIS